MMSNGVTFEQVEQLAVWLLPPEQLKLVARISEGLSKLFHQLISKNFHELNGFGNVVFDWVPMHIAYSAFS